ncbi:ATP-binding protein [uncultured Methanomethylovorans sp.]|uniref:ATP-binding protein n=1 Tax=uncultured Methanomethylovorans sp. TaxID=183759 RepID=UPI002AA8B25C|nr:ATP-binding protein [uncultured Methanomethylovorans sp.]
MPDMTDALITQLKKAQSKYKEALENGNQEMAHLHSEESARICVALAKNSPKEKEKYLKLASNWKNAVIVKGKTPSFHSHIEGNSESSESNNGFKSQAENLISSSLVRWDDIGGLEETKRLLMETIVVAGLQKPESIKPWKGVLLFGPPGTGKTMLASACAGSLDATMFNVQGDKITSKYFGESSKILSSVYDVAKEKAPSIVFMDEIDGVAANRNTDASEASKRMLSTLLTTMDGFASKKNNILILTLAATNAPWDLDDAILSRFPRRIYVPLPDKQTTHAILKLHTKDIGMDCDLEKIAAECVKKCYSGRDLSTISQKAIHTMVNDKNPNLHELARLPFEELKKRKLNTRPLILADFNEAMNTTNPPVNSITLSKYEQWNKEFGA